MRILELADFLDKEIEIIYYPNRDKRFSVSFKDAEIKDGGVLISAYGKGNTIEKAIKNYCEEISNKILVFHAYHDNRQEFKCKNIIY